MDHPQEVTDDHALRQLHEAGLGFIYNDFSGLGATGGKYNVLHAARCPWVPRSNTNVRKFFFATLEAATEWLNSKRGAEEIQWKRCRTCGAVNERAKNEVLQSRGAPQQPKQRTRVSVERSLKEDFVPFKEERVEKCLVAWFEAQGFYVEMRVVVA